MRKLSTALLMILILAACSRGGIKEPKERPRTPDEVQLGKRAFELSNQISAFRQDAPSELSSSLSGLAETGERFSSSSQRFGAGSLEARDAFDKLRYHSVQLNSLITKNKYPDLFDRWQAILTEIRDISIKLGYRPGK